MNDRAQHLFQTLTAKYEAANDHTTNTTINIPLWHDVAEWVTAWTYIHDTQIDPRTAGKVYLGCYLVVEKHKEENPTISHSDLRRWISKQLDTVYYSA